MAIPRWQKLMVLLIPGCRVATEVSYRHAPTAELRDHYDLADPRLADFTRANVATTARFAARSHARRELTVYLVSPEPTEVTVRDWRLATPVAGLDALAGTLEQTVAILASPRGTSVFEVSLTLTEMTVDELERWFAAGPCSLTLTLGAAGAEPTPLVFELERHERQYLAML